jgi:hypothetical protein
LHTTDVKRARFRADSTPASDMLDSCFRLNCHNIRARLPGPSASAGSSTGRVKRARPPPGDLADNDDDEDDDGNASRFTEDSGIAEIARGVGAMGQPVKGRPRTKQTARKSTFPLPATPASATQTPARRVRVKAPRTGESDAESSKAGSIRVPLAVGTPASASTSSPAPATVARKRRPATKPRRTASPTRKPVSAAKPPSTSKPVSTSKPPSTSKPVSAAKPPSTPAPASAAKAAKAKASTPPNSSPLRGRTRSPFKMDSVEIVVRSQSATRSRVRGSGGETADEKMVTDAEGKVRKRRKLGGAGAAA